MTKKNPYEKVIILGSGGLRIGQAGEFDYSGSQAIKALKEEGIFTILVNPNIATVQTDPGMADRVYLQPLNLATVTRIIEKERPDGILLSVGGQSALNLGLLLHDKGVLKQYGVAVLGTSVHTIKITEDRQLFKDELHKIQVKTPKSHAVESVDAALQAAQDIGYPLMMRSGYSLGGLGSGKIANEPELRKKVKEALSGSPQVLIEEYLEGWKEIEYEIVRDKDDNCIAVCNMENFDPMGIHTGESIVVAPSQTLSNEQYHLLREVALKTVRHMGVVGECNIQYALDSKSSDYRVIEMNARLSRSSALASKATGYPLAFVSTKLAIGKRLDEITNNVTKKTTAFFEPALDYLVVKIPRWDTHKLRSAERTIGSEMKSVGEIMAIGRSFPEALQKGIRMLGIGAKGFTDYPHEIAQPQKEVEKATDRRLFALYHFFKTGGTVAKAAALSKIDPWFLHHLHDITTFETELEQKTLTKESLLKAKKMGFADAVIARLQGTTEQKIRADRIRKKIKPVIKQIDTLAGEFAASTNYLYVTYNGKQDDIAPSKKKPIIVLGSGPYCIGSSVEFDWCAVNTAKQLKEQGLATCIINSNPETVSTDFDESDRLYFEELTLERVLDIVDFEKPRGVVVSVGGQIANNLSLPLHKSGVPLLGTPAESIDTAEDRKKFSSLLGELQIDQPIWEEVTTFEKAKLFAKRVGYPLLVRPSYVLSGSAMNVVMDEQELKRYLKEATILSPDHPVVISQFITNAKELEIDGVADQGKIVIQAISEHVENAGVHSGDATIVLPPQRLYLETIRRTKEISKQIAKALSITGPFNIQFIAVENEIKVIECNLRASRSFPFVSKVTNHNFIEIATDVMLHRYKKQPTETLELDYVGVKTPQFSYSRLKGANPVAHVEMASTGEVACIGEKLLDAFYASWLSTEQSVNGKRILVSIGGDHKLKFLPYLRKLEEKGWEICSTEGTHDFLTRHGVSSRFFYKASDNEEPSVIDLVANKQVDLIVNIPTRMTSREVQTDGFRIRRLAIDHHIPLVTNLHTAQMLLQSICELDPKSLPIKSWQEYTHRE